MIDIFVQPDPKDHLNDISTMNKIMEYMALGKPVVSCDLFETRYSGAECALYAVPNSIKDLSKKIMMLAEDEEMRIEIGRKGPSCVENLLD
jgi:glycosyltransferase involved in cell wall biosynthesis